MKIRTKVFGILITHIVLKSFREMDSLIAVGNKICVTFLESHLIIYIITLKMAVLEIYLKAITINELNNLATTWLNVAFL